MSEFNGPTSTLLDEPSLAPREKRFSYDGRWYLLREPSYHATMTWQDLQHKAAGGYDKEGNALKLDPAGFGEAQVALVSKSIFYLDPGTDKDAQGEPILIVRSQNLKNEIKPVHVTEDLVRGMSWRLQQACLQTVLDFGNLGRKSLKNLREERDKLNEQIADLERKEREAATEGASKNQPSGGGTASSD